MFRQTRAQVACQETCKKMELRKICGEKADYQCILGVEAYITSKCESECATYENSRSFSSCTMKQTRKCTEANNRFSQRTYQCEREAEEFCEKSENHKFLWRLFG
uniref:Uncharacterized protein n=1 Tax=Marseillevirus sp. TaxID=2809551 RepID=A0AA96ELG2_9VIRU|nr:hypothetical protein MarFTMF_306 [Marseillevirus sp.]